jgi:hypothetical protein
LRASVEGYAAGQLLAARMTPEAVVIFGSRSGVPESVVRDYVYSLPQDVVVITGGADGVDWYALKAALERRMAVDVFPAQWAKYGKAAGPIRNAIMAARCTRGKGFRVAGWSPGTDDMATKLAVSGKRFDVEVSTWVAC